jgi:hypothetical protein
MVNTFITKLHGKDSFVTIALQKMELALNISLRQKISLQMIGKYTAENNMITHLCCVPEKSICKVLAVRGVNRLRYSEMGVNPGVIIHVDKVFGNMMQINLREYTLAIRKEEAKFIKVSIK